MFNQILASITTTMFLSFSVIGKGFYPQESYKPEFHKKENAIERTLMASLDTYSELEKIEIEDRRVLFTVKFKVEREEIRKQVKLLILDYHRQSSWDKEMIDEVVDILYFGHNTYKIDYRVALAHISHESKMNPVAKGYNIKWENGQKYIHSMDYGLGQQNSRFYKKRYIQAIRILKKEKILRSGRTPTMWEYDVATNAMASILYMKLNRDRLLKVPNSTVRHWVVAYNSGYGGMMENFHRIHKFRAAYYKQIAIYLDKFKDR